MDWRIEPTAIDYWPEDVEYIMALDENGISSLKFVRRCIKNNQPIPDEEVFFTLTGVVLNRENFIYMKKQFERIKNKYWVNGFYDYKGVMKKVCFHSNDIRNRQSPFNIEKFDEFIEDLAFTLDNINFRIISATVNKVELIKRYADAADNPYNLAIHFILERYCYRLNQLNEKGIIILESRGNVENKFVLKHIVDVKENGTFYNKPAHFRNFVGAYFNPKWKKGTNESYVILELADLVSYPIHKYHRYKRKDKDFQLIEKKFFKYPNYDGWGIKYFPK